MRHARISFTISRDDTSSEISLDPDATAEPLNRTSNDNSEFSRPPQFLNRNVMAEQLVMSDDVKHIPEMECFTVKGSDDKKILGTTWQCVSCGHLNN